MEINKRMQVTFLIVCLIGVFTITGAGCRSYHSLGFTLPPGAALRTDGVYIYRVEPGVEYHDGIRVIIEPEYLYVRFFQDGRCFSSYPIKGEVTPAGLEDLSYGDPAYYRMSGDTVDIQLWSLGGGNYLNICALHGDTLYTIGVEQGWPSIRYYDNHPESPTIFFPITLTSRPGW